MQSQEQLGGRIVGHLGTEHTVNLTWANQNELADKVAQRTQEAFDGGPLR